MDKPVRFNLFSESLRCVKLEDFGEWVTVTLEDDDANLIECDVSQKMAKSFTICEDYNIHVGALKLTEAAE